MHKNTLYSCAKSTCTAAQYNKFLKMPPTIDCMLSCDRRVCSLLQIGFRQPCAACLLTTGSRCWSSLKINFCPHSVWAVTCSIRRALVIRRKRTSSVWLLVSSPIYSQSYSFFLMTISHESFLQSDSIRSIRAVRWITCPCDGKFPA